MAGIKDLESRVDALEARLAHLEQYTGTPSASEVAESQQERDERILSRLPNSHAEAVAYEAAKARRDGTAPKDTEEAAPPAVVKPGE